MPTIARPETDVQRLEAHEAASLIGSITAPASLAFSAATLARVNAFLPNYRIQMQQRGSALSAQAGSTTVAEGDIKRLETVVSHFFLVFNLGIKREVYDADDRGHYQLPVSQDSLPDLSTDHAVMTWAGRIVSGDAARVAAGGAAMTNPTAGDVQTKLTAVITSQGSQSLLKTAYDTEQEDVAALREEADDIIADVWDEVLFTFRKDSPPSKRRKAREYGVVYALEPGETPSPDDFSMTGTIKDSATSLPLSGAVVYVVEANVFTNTDDDGVFFVGLLTPGTNYTVQVWMSNYQSTEVTGVVVTAGEITTLNIGLPANPAGTGTISGQVNVGAGSEPATVSVNGTAISTTTGPGGTYNLSNVPGGSQLITATVNSDPANFDTEFVDVQVGGNVVVNFNL